LRFRRRARLRNELCLHSIKQYAGLVLRLPFSRPGRIRLFPKWNGRSADTHVLPDLHPRGDQPVRLAVDAFHGVKDLPLGHSRQAQSMCLGAVPRIRRQVRIVGGEASGWVSGVPRRS
jgi:hypothetical protein